MTTAHASGAEPPAVLQCKCKAVEIWLLGGRVPTSRIECCCFDCWAAVRYAEKKGGPTVPSKAVDSIFFQNDLKLVKGTEKVSFFKMLKGYPMVRLYTKCCWSVLLGDHPVYQGNVVCAYGTTDYNGAVAQADLYPPRARIFTKDLTHQELEALPLFPDPDKIFRCDDSDKAAMSAFLSPAYLAKPTTRGCTMQKLVRQRGYHIPEDFTEFLQAEFGSRYAKPPDLQLQANKSATSTKKRPASRDPTSLKKKKPAQKRSI
eukprot:gnl/MRDRNA2_/MRDRNA2_71795_c0_seq1.p1 gnl/MRDRNA2_/MRDRNA2_71795_c0~~gnl/MRDRNA2_/MRDRNA2_71795_c0_seq1.p1  ORF type:complete len:260 (+),score=37.97 gnl/MRDRNA2_/MRDRNA2_71795_c0_seq1:123-902(+)